MSRCDNLQKKFAEHQHQVAFLLHKNSFHTKMGKALSFLVFLTKQTKRFAASYLSIPPSTSHNINQTKPNKTKKITLNKNERNDDNASWRNCCSIRYGIWKQKARTGIYRIQFESCRQWWSLCSTWRKNITLEWCQHGIGKKYTLTLPWRIFYNNDAR